MLDSLLATAELCNVVHQTMRCAFAAVHVYQLEVVPSPLLLVFIVCKVAITNAYCAHLLLLGFVVPGCS